MSQYDKRGSYAGYDRNNKEREALDYYATPTEEAANILNQLNIDFTNATVLEPSVGGGHLMEGIIPFLDHSIMYCTDIKDRGYRPDTQKLIDEGKITDYVIDYTQDFFNDEYIINNADYVIMNPPYSVIEPFVMKSLEIANKGVLLLARLQFLEGVNRYNHILKDTPPTDVWVYIDRIDCPKNGDFTRKGNSVQAYAWFYWDLTSDSKDTKLHWLHRAK